MTFIFLIAIAAFSIPFFLNRSAFYKFTFSPYFIVRQKEWYRFLTHGFIHADWMHMLMNCLVLYSFGDHVEQYYRIVFGSKSIILYNILFFGGIILSSIPSFFKHKNDSNYHSVGASGAVSSVVFASILFDPTAKLYLMFIPIGIPAFIFGIFYLIYSAYMAKQNADNIGHDAHFWGAVFGFVFTLVLKPSLFLYFISQITGMF